MKRISIVIINYNTREVLRQCLASIDEDESIEVIVVDNGSSDGSAEMVLRCYPRVTMRAKSDNVGYGSAANEAIIGCSADAILLLNSDTLLQKDSAQALLSYLDCHPLTAIVGPRLINSDGTLQPSCYPDPTPLHLFLEESQLGRLFGNLPGIRNRYLRTWRHNKARTVPWVLGAALAIRRDAFMSVEGFDPSFFIYFEEVDLCRRLRTAGWRVEFAPVTTIVHRGGASTSQLYAAMQLRLLSSTLLYYQRHFSKIQLQQLRLSRLPIVLARLMREALRYRRAHNCAESEKAWASLQIHYREMMWCLAPFVWQGCEVEGDMVEGGSR